MLMRIEKVKDGREKYIELLLEADSDINVVEKYINEGDMYIGIVDDEVACEVIITKVNEQECELKNIATKSKFRRRGCAQELIKYVFEEYKAKYKRMIVGTTENMIPFYLLNGFSKYYKTIKNFFIDNYSEKIYDGNLQCIDIYYYSKEFDDQKLD